MLIRALEPLDGIALMRRRRMRSRTVAAHETRRRFPITRCVEGPGNVTHAMGITLRQNGIDLLGDALYIEDRGHRIEKIVVEPAHRHQRGNRTAVALLRRWALLSRAG